MIEDFRLKIFTTVAREGSFTRAALALDISQPAVSQNIAELERLCGVSLFNRSRSEISLTEEGKTLFSYAVRILSAYGEVSGLLSGYEAVTSLKRLKISAKNAAQMEKLASKIVPFLLSLNSSLEITLGLESSEADVYAASDGTLVPSEAFALHPLWHLLKNEYNKQQP